MTDAPPTPAARPATAAASISPSRRKPLLLPLSRPGVLQSALAAEQDAKRLAATELRSLRKMATSSSKQLLLAKNRAHARSLRAEYDSETGKDLGQVLQDVDVAGDAEVLALAKQLNLAMAKVYPDARSQSTYFTLFRRMDRDNSGLISWHEFLKMIREFLKISAPTLPEARLLTIWKWCDTNCDGMINAGEFLKMVRQGWPDFVKEQERLGKTDALRRPNWVNASFVPFDTPVWPEQAMTFQERRRFYLETAQREILQRTQACRSRAQRCDAEREHWNALLEKGLKKAEVRPKSSSIGGARVKIQSASAPALRG